MTQESIGQANDWLFSVRWLMGWKLGKIAVLP